ncbi:MAG: helix-turn-helix transcriptional regulator [Clostridiales bacterium]|jgi:transcriptional regulator with XRE-family HTH domain|nr:helix-turn-helix transcriptional regulator [Clostridiales bacterium]
MTLSEAFSIRLEEYLKARKITVHRFIKASDISRSTITNLMCGNSKSPTLKTVYQVARGLGITPYEFLDCALFRDENLDIDLKNLFK